MLEHNLAAIRYPDYHIFAGSYPNDPRNRRRPSRRSRNDSRTCIWLCARTTDRRRRRTASTGSTSTWDCTRSRTACAFKIVVTHDAEDMIHPGRAALDQLLRGTFRFHSDSGAAAGHAACGALTHGIYCDEFAEYHTRDMTVRSRFGGFVPGAGVGTGYRREALEALAQASGNRMFEPRASPRIMKPGCGCSGSGCPQAFVPLARLRRGTRDFMATREYFPRDWGTALRQRTRWVTGIALQGWQRFGWRGTPSEMYWLWRDRKGLIASPLGALANAVFFYGLATALWRRFTPLDAALTSATFALQMWRMAVRMGCVARVYGALFALGVPMRAVYANALNAAATGAAVARYATREIPRTAAAMAEDRTLLSHPRGAAGAQAAAGGDSGRIEPSGRDRAARGPGHATARDAPGRALDSHRGTGRSRTLRGAQSAARPAGDTHRRGAGSSSRCAHVTGAGGAGLARATFSGVRGQASFSPGRICRRPRWPPPCDLSPRSNSAFI